MHNRFAVVIGAGSLVVEVDMALAGQAQQDEEDTNLTKILRYIKSPNTSKTGLMTVLKYMLLIINVCL